MKRYAIRHRGSGRYLALPPSADGSHSIFEDPLAEAQGECTVRFPENAMIFQESVRAFEELVRTARRPEDWDVVPVELGAHPSQFGEVR